MKEILLVGNPNSGKTTLFNALTSSNEHVGNWHGVTVENKQKTFKIGSEECLLTDTPGIYSLCALSFEEEVSISTILEDKYNKILNIVDQNNLQRNLYLTLCLLEKGCDVVLAINETSQKPIYRVDAKKLSQILGIEVVLINPEKKVGIEQLKQSLAKERVSKKNLPYIKKLEDLSGNPFSGDDKTFLLTKLYERDEKFFKKQKIEDEKSLLTKVPKDSIQQISQLRYNYIERVLEETTKRTKEVYGRSKLDKLFLNKWTAFPMFLLVLFCVFYLTFFSLGGWLSDGLGMLLETISTPILQFIKNMFGSSWIYELFNVAIFGGVATILSFLPQVVLLFFFLSVLEDSGYMSRIAFIFEDIFGKIGLSGKSVYTLLMGFGCSTTAIMTARNMEDKNAKIKTALLCPYMSCSAKIPIYSVIGGAFFGAKNIFVIMGLYFLGVVVAIVVSKILESTILKSNKQSFILEFPPYRATNLKRVFKLLWKNVKVFVVKVGSIMLSMNVIVWLLSNFTFTFAFVPANGGTSMLEMLGRFFAPIFSPLGFGSWAIVCALLAGLVAKEVVVSTIAMFNGIDASASKLVAESILIPSSLIYFSSNASVLSFLIFCLLYTPCIASVSMLVQEVGKKWTIVGICVQLFVAYVVSFMVYNVVFAFEIFGLWKVVLSLVAFAFVLFAIWVFVNKLRRKRKCGYCANCLGGCKNLNKK